MEFGYEQPTKDQNTHNANHSTCLNLTASQKQSFEVIAETDTDPEH